MVLYSRGDWGVAGEGGGVQLLNSNTIGKVKNPNWHTRGLSNHLIYNSKVTEELNSGPDIEINQAS